MFDIQSKYKKLILTDISPGPLARSDACPPGNQTFTDSIPGPTHSSVEIW